jgi:hypothetical protein
MHIPIHLLLAQEAIPTETFFSDFDSNQRFVIAIIAITGGVGALIALVSIVGGMIFRLKEREVEADLKRDLLDRGMSPDEIIKVIEAKPRTGFDKWWSTLGQRSSQES